MDGRLRKQDDGYTRGAVREIRHGCVVVRGREDVDCERSGAKPTRVIAGGVGQWPGVAGREDWVADGSGGGGGERRWTHEQDDGKRDDDDGGDAGDGYYDDDGYDGDDGAGTGNAINSVVYIYDVYV